MTEILALIFLGFGVTILVGAIAMVIGFVVSMPVGVAYAVKERHEHPIPPEPRTPHYRQMRMKLRTWHMPTIAEARNIRFPKAGEQ